MKKLITAIIVLAMLTSCDLSGLEKYKDINIPETIYISPDGSVEVIISYRNIAERMHVFEVYRDQISMLKSNFDDAYCSYAEDEFFEPYDKCMAFSD